MGLDASIAMGVKPVQIEDPMNALAQILQFKNAQNQNRLADMQFQQHQQSQEQANKLNEIYATSVNPDGSINRQKLFQSVATGGMGSQIPGLQKQFAESDEKTLKADSDKFKLASDRAKGYKSDLGALYQDPSLTKEKAVARMQARLQQGLITPEMYQFIVSDLPDDPVALREQLVQGIKEQLTPDQMLTMFAPKTEFKDNGQQLVPVQTNSLAPGYVAPTAIQKLQTPDNTATNERMSREKALDRGIQVRGQNLTDARAKEANRIAGEGQQSSGAPVLGAPVPAVLPWANQSNPKDANKVKANEQTRGAKEIEKDLDAARKERDAAAAAKRFLELNKGTNTGGLLDRIGVTRSLQSLGSDYSEMESITAKLAPAMRVEGSGSTSDFDGKQFERATVGVDKPGPTNQNIAKGVIARAQQSEEYADFRQTYLEQNGTLQGADRFWKDYANKNPIFDPAKEGTFELNNKRKTWKEHFKSGKPASPPAGGGLSPAEAAELADLRKRLGK